MKYKILILLVITSSVYNLISTLLYGFVNLSLSFSLFKVQLTILQNSVNALCFQRSSNTTQQETMKTAPNLTEYIEYQLLSIMMAT